jgi:hypothetical protein
MKKTLLTVAVVSVLSGGLVVATNAFAQTAPPGQKTESSLVQQIAKKFNLNTSDVQEVFDQHRQERQANMESRYEDYLTKLVTSGKITEEQKQLLLTKHKELASQMQRNKEKFKTMTSEERKAQGDAMKTELENWAKENNLDVQYLHPFVHGSRMMRMPPANE